MHAISQNEAPVIKSYGSITITASRTVDGGYAINTFTGPIRETNLFFPTADRDTFRLVYRVIAEGGLNGDRPDGIHAALIDTLTNELHRVQRRHDTPSRNRIEALNKALDLVDPPKPRTFADLRAAFAAGMVRDRAGVAA